MKNLSTLFGACLLCMTIQPLYAEPSPEEVQQTMSSILLKIENAAGLDHKASNGIRELDEEGKKLLYDSVDNKDKFVNSAHKALKRIESARAADPIIQDAPIMQDTSGVALSTAADLDLTTPYPPNYTASVAFGIALGLGLTPSIDQRCDGLGLEIYESAYYAAEKLSESADAVCTGAGCDPTGIICIGACVITEGLRLAVLAAKVPLDACDKHSASVDAAELEAGYENSVGILNDINSTAHDNNRSFSVILDNQKVVIENQGKILKNQEDFLENQEEIIRLLNSPQGQRPSWNK